MEQAGVGRCRVVGKQHDVLQSAETRQGLAQGLLRSRARSRGPYPVDDDLDPALGCHRGSHLVQELEQTTHPDRVRPAHDHDDVGVGHQVGGHRPAPGLEGEVVDAVVDDATGDVDDGPGSGPTALQPDLGHGGRGQLPPAPGPPQAAQQLQPTAHRRQDPLKALSVEAAVGGQASGPGQGRGVLRHSEELDQARSLDVGVHEDRPAGIGQAVGEGGGHGRAPGSAVGPPNQDDSPLPGTTRLARTIRRRGLRDARGGRGRPHPPTPVRERSGIAAVVTRLGRPPLGVRVRRMAPQLFEPGGLPGGAARVRRGGRGGAEPVTA